MDNRLLELARALDRSVSDGVVGGTVGSGVEVDALGLGEIEGTGVACVSKFFAIRVEEVDGTANEGGCALYGLGLYSRWLMVYEVCVAALTTIPGEN